MATEAFLESERPIAPNTPQLILDLPVMEFLHNDSNVGGLLCHLVEVKSERGGFCVL